MGILFGGPTPQDGQSAYEEAVANGFIGTEAQWLASLIGSVGASAYQIAQQQGFSGSVATWLASLVGPQGPQGPAGPDPLAGNTYPQYHFGYGTAAAPNLVSSVGSWAKIGKVVFANGVFVSNQASGTLVLPATSVWGFSGSLYPELSPTVVSYSNAGASNLLNYKNVPVGLTIHFSLSYLTQ